MVADFLNTVTNPNPAYGGALFVNATHQAGRKVLVTVGGATELPITAAYFTQNDPTALAATLAALVRNNSLDGVDVDWEDDYSNQNPGLTGYGSAATRRPGGGPAVAWLVTLTKELRRLLPREEGFLLTHAPQAPYFALGYDRVYRACGSDIDWFNVQFYNQWPSCYTTAATLVNKSTYHPAKSCLKIWDGKALHGLLYHSAVNSTDTPRCYMPPPPEPSGGPAWH